VSADRYFAGAVPPLYFGGIFPLAQAGASRAGGGGAAWPDLPYSRRRDLSAERKAKARPKRARKSPARPPAPAKRRKAKGPATDLPPEVFRIPADVPALPVAPLAPDARAGSVVGDVPAAGLPLAVALALDKARLLNPPRHPGAGVPDPIGAVLDVVSPAGNDLAGVIVPEPAAPEPVPAHRRWPDDEAVCLAAAMLLL
jgi:hypothetical protein